MDYDFSNIFLGPPSTVPGGSYFTRIILKNNKPLYLQTPKCFTKQGFIKSGKKIYTDLMFDNNDNIFISWIEGLEAKCQELIYVKGDSWFQTKLEKDDIDTAFTSPFKIYKSGKFYLLRVNVKPNIKIYGEIDNNHFNLEDISIDKPLISIIEIQGIKFTSRNFQIELELKQSMIVSPDPFLDSCFIKRNDMPQRQILEKVETTVETKRVPVLETTVETKRAPVLETTVETKRLPVLETTVDLEEITEFTFDEDITSDKDCNKDSKLEEEEEEENITLEIEDLDDNSKNIDEQDMSKLKEIELPNSLDNLESITLKKPNQVYYEIYQKAREKAKQAKQAAILAYLEVKNIKKTYMLNDINDSDEEFSM